jgi:hypothetical protein
LYEYIGIVLNEIVDDRDRFVFYTEILVRAHGTVHAFVHGLKVRVAFAEPRMCVRRASRTKVDVVVVGILLVVNAWDALRHVLALTLFVDLLLQMKTAQLVTRFDVPHAPSAAPRVRRTLLGGSGAFAFGFFFVQKNLGVSPTKLGSRNDAASTHRHVVFGSDQPLASHERVGSHFEQRSDGLGERIHIDVVFGRDVLNHLVDQLVNGPLHFVHDGGGYKVTRFSPFIENGSLSKIKD